MNKSIRKMITSTYTNRNSEQIETCDNIIRKYSSASDGNYLLRVDKLIHWDEISDFIFKNVNDIKMGKFEEKVLLSLVKCIIIGKIYKIPDHLLPTEISNSPIYMQFIGADRNEKIPKIKLISSFHQVLIEKGLYDYVIEKFYNQLIDYKFELSESAKTEIEMNNNKSTELVTKNTLENKIELSNGERLHVKMFDLFFDSLNIPKSDEILCKEEIKSHQLMEKLKYVDEMIKELKKKIKGYEEPQNSDLKTDIGIEPENKRKEPIELHPQFKTEGIFNDENLTEDYELGYRFHQLGLKMGFFNVKLDDNNESSRISTAEFFPNTFWTSVKQRSRWIAGICLQNWKAHKWKGNITMKYFLFRDRKPLFSLFGAFFSNIILFYLIYAVVTNLVFGGNAVFLVSHSSVLWYIMAANVIFMVSRASHRFIFTYNWYGFKYAFFSFFRLILDTAINFFAVLRSMSVFRKTKKKVVWDATSHY